MKFQVKVYKISKGNKSQASFLAIINKKIVDKLKLKINDGILISIKNHTFPTVVKKHGSKRFVHGFTIPFKIGRKLKTKSQIIVSLISKGLENPKPQHFKSSDNLNLTTIIPKNTMINRRVYAFELVEKKVLFWIYSKGNRPFILPKSVELRKDNFSLFEVLGAFLCEGFKARKKGKHRDRLSFSNAELEQIKWFTDALENLLGIKREEWSIQILYPKISHKSTKILKKHWSKAGFLMNQISINKNKTVVSPYGICIQNIYNSTLAEIFSFLMEYCKKLVLKNNRNVIDTFRGFSRGDLGVTSDSITFDSENKSDVLLFKQVCTKLGITTGNLNFRPYKHGWWYIRINGWDNFRKILELDGIKHTKRKEKLINIFLKSKRNLRYKYLEAIKNKKNTSKKIANSLNLSIITTRFYLSKFRKEKYVRSYLANKSNRFIYRLTTKGKKELEVLRGVINGS